MKFYGHLTDEQVEEKIKELAPSQVRYFERCLLETDDRRHALFVASSYPISKEDK